jgi:hypothetical protein
VQGHSALWLTAPKPILRCGPQRGITLKVKYLSEIEVIIETALDNETEDQDGSINEKDLRSKCSEL